MARIMFILMDGMGDFIFLCKIDCRSHESRVLIYSHC
ncbi:Uncharacterised protein [Vibrio cholerae]|nr:Uncharacterised protein [Vibrio cholerae]